MSDAQVWAAVGIWIGFFVLVGIWIGFFSYWLSVRRLKVAGPIALPASITCPRCGRTSYNPTDVAEGYCGACHAWTRA